jgi:cytoskeletal protein CcmA (bactofilin family)
MLWERKSASLDLEEPEVRRSEFVPVNMRTPKRAWADNVGIIPSSATTGGTVLGRSVVLKGELFLNEDLVIEGQFEGDITVDDRRVTIGPEAKVKSHISAGEAIVLGAIEGNISAQHKIEIRKSSHVIGDLVAPGIVIESGAYFKGHIEVVNRIEKEQAS